MKKTTTKLVLAGILLSATVNAQQAQTLAPAMNSNHVISASAHTNAKSTALQSRVIGAALLNYSNGFSYTLEDTTFLTYSNDRGHDSALQEIKFDVLVSQNVVANVPVNNYKYTQTFDGDDNVLTNLQQNWNTGTNTWDNANNTVYTYDGNDNMLTSVSQNWNSGTNTWENYRKEIYTYDGDNNMLTHVIQYWDNVFLTWVNSTQYIYNYNVNNQRTMEVYQNWNNTLLTWVNSTKSTMVYDANDDMTTSLFQTWDNVGLTWVNNSQHLYTYDANHHMLTDVSQYVSMSVWVNSSKYTYAYTGNDATTVVYQNWNNMMMTWDNNSRSLRTFDADHNMISQVNQDWNTMTTAFDNVNRTQYTYNSFNQPTSMWSDQWNAGIWQVQTSDYKQNLYYETYGTNSVANTAAVADFNLYPVPAQNFVRIEKTFTTPQSFTVSITDLQGRLVRTYSEKATTNYSRNIDVNQLSSGNYVIKIATANGKASYQQFTVAH